MKYINADKLKQAMEDKYCFTEGNIFFDLINELSEEMEDVIDVPSIRNKLGSIVTLIELSEGEEKFNSNIFQKCRETAKKAVNYLAKREVFYDRESLLDELSKAKLDTPLKSWEKSEPTPLKVAIKGDCTYDYSKKIFQYFKSHTIKGQHDVDSFLEDVYYYIEKGNIVFSPFLPEGYTEISLKEESSKTAIKLLKEAKNNLDSMSSEDVKRISKEKGIIIPEDPNELKNLESSKISYLHSVINANQIALKYQTERILELEEIIKDLKK